MAQKQLNVRVDDDAFWNLEAAAYVRDVSLPDLIRPFLLDLAETFAREAAVQTVLRGRREHVAAEEGKLTSLEAHRPGAQDAGA